MRVYLASRIYRTGAAMRYNRATQQGSPTSHGLAATARERGQSLSRALETTKGDAE